MFEDGRTVWPHGDGTISLGEHVAPQIEPDHPTLRGARFIASTGIMVGDWRVGVWRFSRNRSILAAYHPGGTDALLPIMDITKPALGVAYLGAPDAAGGNFAIFQQLGGNSYRWSVVSWGEQAVRAPIAVDQLP